MLAGEFQCYADMDRELKTKEERRRKKEEKLLEGIDCIFLDRQDSLRLSLRAKMALMICTETLKAHVSPEIKLQAKTVADREFLSEAAWLKRLVLREIRACDVGGEREPGRVAGIGRRSRAMRGENGHGKPILVNLTGDDRLLVDARAEARGMRSATYVSVLIRSHLRRLAPLPKDELLALKRSIGELASIGRNINQIAKVVNEGGRAPGSVREEFRAMLKICEALRENTKALLKANEISWQTGEPVANL